MPPEPKRDPVEGPGVLDRLSPPVSRETRGRLEHYVALLRSWQRIKNLVGPGTLDAVWTRHVLDSAAVIDAVPEARRFVDLGSGAGFPGLVIAILLARTPGAHVTLVESNSRKASFLRTVARETDAPVTVYPDRIEDAVPKLLARGEPIDVVTARALAPLDRLLQLAGPLLARGAVGVFHKGRELEAEVAAARDHWRFDLVEHPSSTDPSARLVAVRNVGRLAGAPGDQG
jgi:16S rRNA (guanine527-N7)-methyltransferase